MEREFRIICKKSGEVIALVEWDEALQSFFILLVGSNPKKCFTFLLTKDNKRGLTFKNWNLTNKELMLFYSRSLFWFEPVPG